MTVVATLVTFVAAFAKVFTTLLTIAASLVTFVRRLRTVVATHLTVVATLKFTDHNNICTAATIMELLNF